MYVDFVILFEFLTGISYYVLIKLESEKRDLFINNVHLRYTYFRVFRFVLYFRLVDNSRSISLSVMFNMSKLLILEECVL